jgi:hypothetical protein
MNVHAAVYHENRQVFCWVEYKKGKLFLKGNRDKKRGRIKCGKQGLGPVEKLVWLP